MTAKEYFRRTARTWNKGEPFKQQVDNAVLGIIGEVGEFTRDATDSEELGDIQYYLATFFRLCGEKPSVMQPEKLVPRMVSVREVLGKLTELAEHTKKWIHHGKIDRKPKAIEAAKYVAGCMYAICTYSDWDMREVWYNNIEKLEGRYPEGFDKDNAPS